MKRNELANILQSRFFVIAGPCVIENEEMILATAEKLKTICQDLNIPLIFKSSFDKANRSSADSFRGPGLEKGLQILDQVKRNLNLPILTDVHETAQVNEVADVADIIQIPAFLCRQTDLLVACARSGAIVNVKKGQFLSPFEVKNMISKIRPFSEWPILVTERGSSFGYNNLVVDFRALEWMKKDSCLTVFDATHSAMLPAAMGGESGGDREMAKVLARAAMAVGVNGLFFETHPDPSMALSDKAVVVPLNDVPEWLECLKEYRSLSEKYRFI